MLNDLWLLVSGLLILVGLLASESLLLIVGSFVVLIWLATKVWDRYAFRRVSHFRSLTRHRAFIGDTLEYSVCLRNDKILPLIWVDIHDTLPDGLELPGANLRSNSIEGNPTGHNHDVPVALPASHLEVHANLRVERLPSNRPGASPQWRHFWL